MEKGFEMRLKDIGLSVAVGALALAVAPAASAANVFHPGDPNFTITNGTPFTPSITAVFFDSFSAPTTFDDNFVFTIPQDGTGSGSISTSFSGLHNKLVITNLFVDGTAFSLNSQSHGQSLSLGNVPIVSGVPNDIEVEGYVLHTGSYSGTLTFTAGVIPEPATWGMMILGVGMLGLGLRLRKAPSFAV
jgi:hypothetical protein